MTIAMDRSSLLDKIRALMSKTVENGCTEAEALAALTKARAMMDAHEVTDEDLAMTAKETADVIRGEPKDPHSIKRFLATPVAGFCDCKVWRHVYDKAIVFCGLPADAQFADWLLGTLAAQVRAELTAFLITVDRDPAFRRRAINGFVYGACGRIGRRLNDLVAASRVQATSNGRALVLTKASVIKAKMDELNLNLRKSRGARGQFSNDGYAAGQAAGDRASFSRPVSGEGATLRLTQ